jgi:hypothetical protein
MKKLIGLICAIMIVAASFSLSSPGSITIGKGYEYKCDKITVVSGKPLPDHMVEEAGRDLDALQKVVEEVAGTLPSGVTIYLSAFGDESSYGFDNLLTLQQKVLKEEEMHLGARRDMYLYKGYYQPLDGYFYDGTKVAQVSTSTLDTATVAKALDLRPGDGVMSGMIRWYFYSIGGHELAHVALQNAKVPYAQQHCRMSHAGMSAEIAKRLGQKYGIESAKVAANTAHWGRYEKRFCDR